MPNVIALLGLFLFWLSVLWMPLSITRGIYNRGPVQVWAIASIFAFGMVFMGYTRAMMQGTAAEAFAWSVSWAMPLGLALFARSNPDAVYRGFDKYVGIIGLLLFIPVVGALPGVLRQAAEALW
ncbi:MAG: hypothetical protein HKO95_04215 [Rhodobacteraceae bacterium]|nr:hypothetical protein [Paracoccaceae bacterium]NNK65921.1 hypothetical protein [Paracoccaceae bacterium]